MKSDFLTRKYFSCKNLLISCKNIFSYMKSDFLTRFSHSCKNRTRSYNFFHKGRQLGYQTLTSLFRGPRAEDMGSCSRQLTDTGDSARDPSTSSLHMLLSPSVTASSAILDQQDGSARRDLKALNIRSTAGENSRNGSSENCRETMI